MNERIQDLMGKTLDDKFSHTWDTMTYEGLLQFSEKFAELIVRECLEQIHIQSRGPCGDYHGEWYESDILKHFGVEE